MNKKSRMLIFIFIIVFMISFITSCSNSETSKIGTNTEIQDTSTTQTTIPETTASSKIETTTETETTVLKTTTTKSESTTTTKQTTTTETTTATSEQATTTVAETTTTISEETTTTQSDNGPFVGSKNSDVYHYPSCSSAKQIHSENLVTFSSVKEAKNAGYRPCKRCNPPG